MIGVEPLRYTLGAIVSWTIIVRTADPVFPLESTFMYDNGYVPGTTVLTVPLDALLIGPLPSKKSVQLAPGSAKEEPASIVIVESQFRVTTGAVLSSTITVRVTVLEVFAALSVWIYSIVYVPSAAILTVPLHAITEPVPSTMSVQLAPGSKNEPVEASTIIGVAPERVRTGPTVSAIVTTCVPVEKFPAVSIHIILTLVTPTILPVSERGLTTPLKLRGAKSSVQFAIPVKATVLASRLTAAQPLIVSTGAVSSRTNEELSIPETTVVEPESTTDQEST